VRQRYGIGKAVVVADKGMNTQQNAYYLANGRGGYIFSQTVAGGTKDLKGYVLKEGGYAWNGDRSFKKKSRQFTRRVDFVEEAEGAGGAKAKRRVQGEILEKQVVFWSKDYESKAKAEREKAVQKAKDLIKRPGKYNKYTSHGAAKYVKNLRFDEDGGIVELNSKLVFDHEALAEDELYDGYYVIATSCHDASDDWVIDHYRGLWEIEETFKVTKGDLNARPVFVARRDHVEAHFLVCFIALVILRLIQKKLGGAYSTTRIVESLRNVNCIGIDTNRYVFGYRDAVVDALGEAMGINFLFKYRTQLDIRKALGETKRG
jgi:transposase